MIAEVEFETKHPLTQEAAQGFWAEFGTFSRVEGTRYAVSLHLEEATGSVAEWSAALEEMVTRLTGDAILLRLTALSVRVAA